MFCSNCGAADQSTNSYCRRCGRYLQDPSPWRRRDSPERMAFWLAVGSVISFLFCLGVMVTIAHITRHGGSRGYLMLSFGLCGGIAGYLVGCFIYGLRLRRRFINSRELAEEEQGKAGLKEADTARLPAAGGAREGATALLDAEPARVRQPR
jgi:hypothetical protein